MVLLIGFVSVFVYTFYCAFKVAQNSTAPLKWLFSTYWWIRT